MASPMRAASASLAGSEPPSCRATGCSASANPKNALAIAMDRGIGNHHFGIEQGMACELPVEGPAVSVRPVDHRRYGKAIVAITTICFSSIDHPMKLSTCLLLECVSRPQRGAGGAINSENLASTMMFKLGITYDAFPSKPTAHMALHRSVCKPRDKTATTLISEPLVRLQISFAPPNEQEYAVHRGHELV